jgi:hypothetical protein
MSRVAGHEAGIAASLRNTGQQLGGSIGLAVLGTVAWSAVAHSARTGYHHAIATGFARGFLVTAGIMVLALIITIIAIPARRPGLEEAGV